MDVSCTYCVFFLYFPYSRSQRDDIIYWALEFDLSECSFILFIKEIISWHHFLIIRTLLSSGFIKFSLSSKGCHWVKKTVEWEGMVLGDCVPVNTISPQQTLFSTHEVSTHVSKYTCKKKTRIGIHRSLHRGSLPFLPSVFFLLPHRKKNNC